MKVINKSSSWFSLPLARDIRITQPHIQQCDTLASDKAHSIKTMIPIQNKWINKKTQEHYFYRLKHKVNDREDSTI